MIEINEISDDYAIKIFKLRVFKASSLTLFFLIGLYNLFIYLTNPELLGFCLIVGVIGYIIAISAGFFVMNGNLKKDKEFRDRAIEATTKYIENKRRNHK